MTRHDHDPQPLGEVLRGVARRVRRVYLGGFGDVVALWDSGVEEPLRSLCRPEFVRDGVLVVSVPSGAFAERIRAQAEEILRVFEPLGERAPQRVKTVQRA